MDTTSLSLIDRLQADGNGPEWSGLLEVYRPLLRRWLRRFDVQSVDEEDLLQEVLWLSSKISEIFSTTDVQVPFERG